MNATAELKKTGKNAVAEELSTLLADTYLLYVKTQNFHWNVCDPRFHSLHEFFEEQYEALAEAVDEIAERIRAIGSKAPGTMQQFLSLSRLRESEGNLKADEMLRELLADHEKIIEWLKEEVDRAEEAEDPGSSDLCVQRLRAHEKTAWMIKSHIGGVK